MGKLKAALSLILVAAMASAMTASAGKTYVVGDNHGWELSDNPNFFEEWAKGKDFQPGDNLEFNFQEPGSNVLLTDERGFKACLSWEYDGELKEVYHRSPLIFNLKVPGDYYFRSGIARQCEAGLKLHVRVDQ